MVALIITMVCAWLARFWVNDEFVGETETLGQFLAHLFFLQDILGFESISAGVWYVAIDWQLYSVLAFLLIYFSSYQALIWLISIAAVSSLLYFNRSSKYEAYFVYFIGSYVLTSDLWVSLAVSGVLRSSQRSKSCSAPLMVGATGHCVSSRSRVIALMWEGFGMSI